MSVWRYYFKMIRYEQFLVPSAMMGICLLLIILLKSDRVQDFIDQCGARFYRGGSAAGDSHHRQQPVSG